MRKAIKRKVAKVDTLAIPDAENAKWLALGLLVSSVLVVIFCLVLLQIKAN